MLKKNQPGGFDPIGVPKKTIFQKLKKQGAANEPSARWLWPPVFSIFERLFFSELRSDRNRQVGFFSTPFNLSTFNFFEQLKRMSDFGFGERTRPRMGKRGKGC